MKARGLGDTLKIFVQGRGERGGGCTSLSLLRAITSTGNKFNLVLKCLFL